MRAKTNLLLLSAAALAATSLAACSRVRDQVPAAPVPGSPEADAAGRLAAGAAALEIGNFSAARNDLGWVYTRCPATEAGQTALLLLAATYLDPRNQERRPDLAAAMAALVAEDPDSPPTLSSAGTSLFLLAREQGAPAPHTGALREAAREARRTGTGCTEGAPRTRLSLFEMAARPDERTDGENAAPSALPDLGQLSVPERIAAVTAQRDSLARRVTELEAQVKALNDRVAIQQQELERIRRTLRP